MPGVRGVFMGEKMSARSCGAGEEGGEESKSNNRVAALFGVGAPRWPARGVKAPVGLYFLGLMSGVACTRYVLSRTRWSSGSLLVCDCFVAVGCMNGEDSKPLMSGRACDLPGVTGSSFGVLVPPILGLNSDFSAS